MRMRDTEILIGSHVWSRKNSFSWIMFIFSLLVNLALKDNSK